jgi:hypothetical protein
MPTSVSTDMLLRTGGSFSSSPIVRLRLAAWPSVAAVSVAADVTGDALVVSVGVDAAEGAPAKATSSGGLVSRYWE